MERKANALTGMTMTAAPTAAVLLIGDEILSGRTKDKNLGFIADFLTAAGIDLKEARVVADIEDDIVAALNALRARYTYVFTTGGIGPTHDDITADAVGRAFGLPVDHDPEAKRILLAYFAEIGREPNEARLRMARVPQGAALIENTVSKAPGFRIGNVFVMAGVPKIMQSMLEALSPQLARGVPMVSRTVTVFSGEGDLAGPLKDIQARHAQVIIGSYPFEGAKGYASNLVLRSRDPDALATATAEVKTMAGALTEAGKAKGYEEVA
jgi:molybdenum cofactor synthesis domain-containing protein